MELWCCLPRKACLSCLSVFITFKSVHVGLIIKLKAGTGTAHYLPACCLLLTILFLLKPWWRSTLITFLHAHPHLSALLNESFCWNWKWIKWMTTSRSRNSWKLMISHAWMIAPWAALVTALWLVKIKRHLNEERDVVGVCTVRYTAWLTQAILASDGLHHFTLQCQIFTTTCLLTAQFSQVINTWLNLDT